jgi:hypothetical protein
MTLKTTVDSVGRANGEQIERKNQVRTKLTLRKIMMDVRIESVPW